MISFLKFILESKEEKHDVVSFTRSNPPHEGHGEVVHTGQEEAKKVGGTYHYIVSHSHDPEKNPLTPEQKVKHVKRAWPGLNVSSSSKEEPSLLHHLARLHKSGTRHVTIVGGSDRDAMAEMAKKYNGVKGKHGYYKFKSMNFVQAGAKRSEDAKGKASFSASRMREAARKGKKKEFHAMAPSGMKPEHKDEMYNDVRKGMGVE